MSTVAKAKRFAADIWNKYQTDGNFQDIAETLGGAGVAAAGQAIFTDMSPEEIALSTLLGGAAAFAARKPAAELGYAVGRKLDNVFPNSANYGGMMSPTSPRGHEIHGRILDEIGKNIGVDNLRETDVLYKLFGAKGVQNFVRPDGTERGYLEGTLGGFGRNRGDNIAQAAVAFTAPFLLGNSGSETDETGQSYVGI